MIQIFILSLFRSFVRLLTCPSILFLCISFIVLIVFLCSQSPFFRKLCECLCVCVYNPNSLVLRFLSFLDWMLFHFL